MVEPVASNNSATGGKINGTLGSKTKSVHLLENLHETDASFMVKRYGFGESSASKLTPPPDFN
jgi:hypothetical protein